MKAEQLPNEVVIKEGAANLQSGIEAVGGTLYLTSQRLIFEAHKINVQVAATEVELSAIQSLRPCWTKFIGLVPLFPNSLAVFTAKGKEYRFVLINRRSWATAINEQKESINA